MRIRFSVLCALLSLLAGPVWMRSAEGPQVFAIRNARIAPVSRAPIEKGTVVIRDGLIEAVGANVDPPADAWVIDGAGLTVYPGLIDALSAWGIPAAAAATTGRKTGRRTPVI
jgi:dihydroorotase-like cyclic amidohydrolase